MNTRLLSMITLVAGIAACSSTPDTNNQLEQARAEFERAQSNPQVVTLAAEELKEAGDSLRTTERAWKEREEQERINHLAYLTKQRVTIAQESAKNRAAQETISNAAAERDRMRLALRTNEADSAKRDLAQTEAEAKRMREAAAERVSDLESQLKELNAEKTDRGMVVTLGDVLFDTGKSELLAGSRSNLSKLAEVMRNNPDTTALVEGHTDSVGSASFNYSLSQRRADSVRDALVNMGVKNDRLSTRAHGPDVPKADNSSAAGRQMNRRVEIVFTE